MKTAARSLCVAVLTLVAYAGIMPTAQAKGPTDVDVAGPGVDADLTGTRRADDVDLGTLARAALLYQHWDGSGLGKAPRLSPDQLGPRYVLTWTVAGADWAVQHAYPFAKGGAWVHFAKGGWVKAPALTQQLVGLGAAAEPVAAPAVAAVESAAAPASPRADHEDSSTAYDLAIPVGVLLAGALLVGGLLIIHRRRLSRSRGNPTGPGGVVRT